MGARPKVSIPAPALVCLLVSAKYCLMQTEFCVRLQIFFP